MLHTDWDERYGQPVPGRLYLHGEQYRDRRSPVTPVVQHVFAPYRLCKNPHGAIPNRPRPIRDSIAH